MRWFDSLATLSHQGWMNSVFANDVGGRKKCTFSVTSCCACAGSAKAADRPKAARAWRSVFMGLSPVKNQVSRCTSHSAVAGKAMSSASRIASVMRKGTTPL